MKHDFLDRYSRLSSTIHSLDPRAKILAFGCAILIMATEPRGELLAFAAYYPGVLVPLAASRLPLHFVAKRLLIAAPVVLAAAIMLPLSALVAGDAGPLGGPREALFGAFSLALRAFAALILLTLLGSTSRFHRLLWGLRRLGMPRQLGVVCALMYRYIFILSDELLRTTMARQSRSAGGLRVSRASVYGHQAAVIFLRGWERAERIHGAMLARGFSGEFPGLEQPRFAMQDALFTASCILFFLTARIMI